MSDVAAWLLMIASWVIAFFAARLGVYSLLRLMDYHTRRLSVGILYMQWERDA
jgi:uncharacterized membrane protein